MSNTLWKEFLLGWVEVSQKIGLDYLKVLSSITSAYRQFSHSPYHPVPCSDYGL